MLAAVASVQLEAVGVGVLGPVGDIPNLDSKPGTLEPLLVVEQPLVVLVPTEEAAVETKVGALRLVRRRQRARRVVIDNDLRQLPADQIAAEPADSVPGGAVRTARPAHYRTENVVEDAGRDLGHGPHHTRSLRPGDLRAWLPT